MRIHYKVREQGAEIIRLFTEEASVWLPDDLDGLPVTEIASYAFSARKEGEDEDVLVWEDCCEEERIFGDEIPLACGDTILELHLPPHVCRLGNYALYGCRNLRFFHATDRLLNMGSGAFTGCRLSHVQIDFYDGEQSCLKEILTEIRYEIRADLYYFREGCKEEARLLFPEYYADAVENTPARIVETHYYGSGGDYRECFYRRELDFEKYDGMFILSKARDEAGATADLALGRLLYPYKLGEKAKQTYQAYLRDYMPELIIMWLSVDREDTAAIIEYCCREHLFTEETMEAAVFAASEHKQADIAGMLMDEQRRMGRARRKTFDL